MAKYIVQFIRSNGPLLESGNFESFQAAQAFAAEQRSRLLADSVAIQEIDGNGKGVGQPHLMRL